jgi:hypothetical protein
MATPISSLPSFESSVGKIEVIEEEPSPETLDAELSEELKELEAPTLPEPEESSQPEPSQQSQPHPQPDSTIQSQSQPTVAPVKPPVRKGRPPKKRVAITEVDE